MPARKVPAPREYEFNDADLAAFRKRFWRCPVRLVEQGAWRAMWAGGGQRGRGGGAAGALLPVLAMHVWPGQEDAVPGWSGSAALPYRRLARLSGLDKDTVTTALEQLVAAGLVRVDRTRFAAGDVRLVARVRLAAHVFANGRDPHVGIPAAFVYGGGWSRLPGAAAKHLCVAWAAWAAGVLVDPAAGRLPRTRRRLLEALVPASGMGATAVRAAVGALSEWENGSGERLVIDAGGFLRPDFRGEAARYEWPLPVEADNFEATPRARPKRRSRKALAEGAGELAGPAVEPAVGPAVHAQAEGTQAGGEAQARGDDGPRHQMETAAASASSTGVSPARVRSPKRSMRTAVRPAHEPPAASPAGPSRARPAEHQPRPVLDGPGSFEARKLWWMSRYLQPWANRLLRRRWEPVRQVVLVDLCPGAADERLPPALQVAVDLAKRLQRYAPRGTVPFRIVAVEPDPAAARLLRDPRPPFDPLFEVSAASPAATLRDLARDDVALLTFVCVEGPADAGAGVLRAALAGDDREVVGLSLRCEPDLAAARLWREGDAGRLEDGSVAEAFARAGLGAGAETAFAVPVTGPGGAAAGSLCHLSVRTSALPAWKAAIGPARRGEERDEFSPSPYPRLVEIAESLTRANSGRTVAWCDCERSQRSLRTQVLGTTPTLPLDFLALRRQAALARWKRPGRRIAYEFPPL